MSFSESRSSPFIPPAAMQSYVPGSDAISIHPQFSVEPTAENRSPDYPDPNPNPSPFKRARTNSDDNAPSSSPPMNNNRGNNNNIFWKTRLCAKFKAGMCRNGEHCNFAHGIEDMRQPPPNWQEIVGLRGGEDDGNHSQLNRQQFSGEWEDDQKIIHRMKLCKKFYNGEECPYGDRCNFLHEDPAKFRDDSGRFRESSAISIGTTLAVSVAVGGVGGEESRGVSSNNMNNNNNCSNSGNNNNNNVAGLDMLMRGNVKPSYWKTKLCNKWEQTGHCPFGDKCHFAHGFPELQASSGRPEMESMSMASLGMKPQGCSGNDLVSPGTSNVGAFNDDRQSKKCLLRWKGLKKINRIYGDWLDDLPLAHNIPSRVES